MKGYKELGLSRLGAYGAMVYTMYKSGLITEIQVMKLGEIPEAPESTETVFKMIDDAFER